MAFCSSRLLAGSPAKIRRPRASFTIDSWSNDGTNPSSDSLNPF